MTVLPAPFGAELRSSWGIEVRASSVSSTAIVQGGSCVPDGFVHCQDMSR